MNKFWLLCCALFIGHIGLSQITVDNSVSAEVAMQTLLGENVTISNLQFTGFNEQIGTFACEECGLDFDEGVIIASGDVDTALGPNQSGSNTIGGNFGSGSDVDLDLLNPTSAGDFNDIAVLEFDFIALGDSVWFDYVFASDEYPEFSGSAFNDTFGFFMSGPGIAGPYSDNSENLAIIPGTDIGVTINNVNAGTAGTAEVGDAECNNCEYYENNGTGQPGQPQYDDPNVVGYDGYTVGLRAIRGGLICGETYHLRIVIADAGDNSYDSAVILRAGSLSSNLVVQVELLIEATTEEGIMNEECGLSTLHFIRPEAIDSSLEFIVEVEYAGDAVNGVDYTLLPETITLPPGIDTVTYVLDAFEDATIEGLESVQFIMQNLAVCQGEAVPSFFEFFITESTPVEIEGYDVIICDGASVELTPIIGGGSGGFEYTWNTTETTSSILVSPTEETTYGVTVSDTCLVDSDNANFVVEVAAYPPLDLNSAPSELDISCNWFGEFLSGTASGGEGTYSYEWTDEDGSTLSSNSDFFIFNATSELYFNVTDGCGITETLEIPITTDIEILTVDVPESVNICLAEQTISADITGEEPINITWFDQNWSTLGTEADLTLNPTEDMVLNLNVSDNCNQFFSTTVEVNIVDAAPLIIDPIEDFTAECEEEVTLNSPVISGTPDYNFEWSTEAGANLGTADIATLIIEESQLVFVDIEDACGETAQDTVAIFLVQTPLELTVPSELEGDCLTEFNIEALQNQDEDIPLSWSGSTDLELIDNYNVSYQSLSSALITVSGDAGCQNTAEETIQINVSSPELIVTATDDQQICDGETAFLSAQAEGGSGLYVYEWLGQEVYESTLSVVPDNSSSYTVEITDECLNSVTTSSFVQVEFMSVSFTYIQQDFNQFTFIPNTSGECEECAYFWEFSDGSTSSEQSPTHTFNQISDFEATLSVVSDNGCLNEFTDGIYVPVIYVPNSFTPNNDGLNDVFAISATGISKFNIEIFNRWGELVYESNDPAEVWEGEHKKGEHYVSNGIYSYVIRYKSLNTESKIKKGTISVIR